MGARCIDGGFLLSADHPGTLSGSLRRPCLGAASSSNNTSLRICLTSRLVVSNNITGVGIMVRYVAEISGTAVCGSVVNKLAVNVAQAWMNEK